MYWFLNGSSTSAIPLAVVWAGWMIGGWLVARRVFRLEPAERWTAGIAVGAALFLFAANLLARGFAPGLAFAIAGGLVLLTGLAVTVVSRGSPLQEDLAGWKVLAVLVAATLLFTLVGRGLAILDDRKNLSLISLMAAGDVPPHFYMNPATTFRYHYAFQLLGASAVRLGGMFPWSAFDLTKGFVAALSLAVGYLAGRRISHRSIGGWLTAGALLFAGGARWVLLLVPPGFLDAAGSQVELWGSAATAATTLRQALLGPWVVAGGPPLPIPFAYLSGLLEPFVLGMQAGPGSLSRTFLLLMPLVLPRLRGRGAAAVLSAVFAVWALAWESAFVLFAGGIVLWTGAVVIGRGRAGMRGGLHWAVGAVVAGGLLSLFQGGTLTEMLRSTLAGPESSGSLGALFSLRWPPALVSSHLGELRLDRWPTLIVALAELGAPVIAAPFVIARGIHWGRRGRFTLAALALASVLGAVLPLIVRYRAERDISRLTSFSLLVWAVLAVPLILAWLRRSRGVLPIASVVGGFGLLTFAGMVVSGSLLTAIPRGVFTEKVAPLDAAMAGQLWDRLPPDALVFDSHPWRSIVLTGRPALSSRLDYEPLPAWSRLVLAPSAGELARAGYTHVYADEHWLRNLPDPRWYEVGCVEVVSEGEDNADNGIRYLFDIRNCVGAP